MYDDGLFLSAFSEVNCMQISVWVMMMMYPQARVFDHLQPYQKSITNDALIN